MQRLTLEPFNDGVFRVLDSHGQQLGNLKLINGQWKFKAIGFDAQGAVVPGGGPLTNRHNEVFATPDEAAVNDRLNAAPPH